MNENLLFAKALILAYRKNAKDAEKVRNLFNTFIDAAGYDLEMLAEIVKVLNYISGTEETAEIQKVHEEFYKSISFFVHVSGDFPKLDRDNFEEMCEEEIMADYY